MNAVIRTIPDEIRLADAIRVRPQSYGKLMAANTARLAALIGTVWFTQALVLLTASVS
jgi:hypothetical protein